MRGMYGEVCWGGGVDPDAAWRAAMGTTDGLTWIVVNAATSCASASPTVAWSRSAGLLTWAAAVPVDDPDFAATRVIVDDLAAPCPAPSSGDNE